MSSNQPTKKGWLPKGASRFQRILIMIALGLGVLAVIAIVASVFFGGNNANTDRLVAITAKQTELARVAAIGEKDAVGTDAKNLASTVSLSIISGQQQLLSVLSSQGKKVKPQELNSMKNEKTDQRLVAAGQSNQFDEIFNEVIQTGLKDYHKALNDAYNNSSSKAEKAVLENLYKQVSLLIVAED